LIGNAVNSESASSQPCFLAEMATKLVDRAAFLVFRPISLIIFTFITLAFLPIHCENRFKPYEMKNSAGHCFVGRCGIHRAFFYFFLQPTILNHVWQQSQASSEQLQSQLAQDKAKLLNTAVANIATMPIPLNFQKSKIASAMCLEIFHQLSRTSLRVESRYNLKQNLAQL